MVFFKCKFIFFTGGGDDKLKTCKEVRVRHILNEKQGKVLEPYNALQAKFGGGTVPGAEFGVLAQQFSSCSSAKKGGDLGWFGRGKMLKQFEDIAFNLPIGQVSPLFKTVHGYHILLVEGRR